MSLARRKTHEEYVRELKERDIQAEPLESYQGSNTKIKHLWKACGHVTDTTPKGVLSGRGCGTCFSIPKKTHSQYLEDLQSKGIKAEPLETYVNSRTKLKHRWSCGHVTEVRPDSVLKGNGCGTCLGKHLKTHEWYVRELKERGIKVRPLDFYKGSHTKIRHEWEECRHVTMNEPHGVLQGYGCRECHLSYNVDRGYAQECMDRSISIMYEGRVWRDVSTPYINARTKLRWRCCLGHTWEALPYNVKRGKGCPECNAEASASLGERFTREVLEEHGIEFQTQKKFPDLYHKSKRSPLSYDFYIPSMDILIECQGEQHYKPVDFMGGAERFTMQQENDRLKREYAQQNGYYLLEISYKDYRKDRIKAILEDAGVLRKQSA